MKAIEYIARGLALLWAAFWTFFFIAESLAWHTAVGRTMIWSCIGLVFVLLALAAWRWEVAGGLLLVIAGLLAMVAYLIWGPTDLPVSTRINATVLFGLPPTLAGALFMIHHHRVGQHG